MSVTIDRTALTRDWVAFTDDNGHAEMSMASAIDLWQIASADDWGRVWASPSGRRFDRDDLRAVLSAAFEAYPCQNPAHHLAGVDLPGTEPRAGGLWFCPPCSSACDEGGAA